jgi:hypothetical protein
MAMAFGQTVPCTTRTCTDAHCQRSSPLPHGARRQHAKQLRALRQQPTASRTALHASASAVAAAKAPAVETRKAKQGTAGLTPEIAEDLYRWVACDCVHDCWQSRMWSRHLPQIAKGDLDGGHILANAPAAGTCISVASSRRCAHRCTTGARCSVSLLS